MNATLENLKNVVSDNCITIILETHRTLPDNEKDSLLLKNLIKETEKRLLENHPKNFVKKIITRINDLAESIDHRQNKESLILFVNENIAEYIRLPITVENRIVIDKTFATRDLVRALHRETPYYILILGRNKARLIEAFNDKLIDEVSNGFPLINSDLNPIQRSEAGIGRRKTNLAREFFNRVDKQLKEVRKENPLPVIIGTDESNYTEFLKTADKKEIFVEKFFGNRINDKAHHIVEAAWPVMQKWTVKKNNQRLAELKKAINSRNVLIDFNEIWQAINNGKGKTLFVKQGYFQPVRIENNHIELVFPGDSTIANVDDVIDEMIEKNLHLEGDVVFVNGSELEKFNGLVLVTRH